MNGFYRPFTRSPVGNSAAVRDGWGETHNPNKAAHRAEPRAQGRSNMKSTAADSGRRVFPGRGQFILAGILSIILTSTPILAQTPGPRPLMIRGGPVLDHQMSAVGDA